MRPYVLAMRPHLVKSTTVQSLFVNHGGMPFSCAGLTVYYSNM